MDAVPAPRTTTALDRLRDQDFQAQICEAIVSERGMRKACEKLGICTTHLWREMAVNETLRKTIWEARAQTAEMLWDECNDIMDAPLPPRITRTLANGDVEVTGADELAHRRAQVDTRQRTAGKLLPRIYGEQQAQTNVNVGLAVGLVCDEEQRKRLIALRQELTGKLPVIDLDGKITASTETTKHIDVQ